MPQVLRDMLKEAGDFLKCCFIRNPVLRFTVEIMLNHQYIQCLDEDGVFKEEEVADLNGIESVWENDFCSCLFPDECSFESLDALISYVCGDDLNDAASSIT